MADASHASVSTSASSPASTAITSSSPGDEYLAGVSPGPSETVILDSDGDGVAAEAVARFEENLYQDEEVPPGQRTQPEPGMQAGVGVDDAIAVPPPPTFKFTRVHLLRERLPHCMFCVREVDPIAKGVRLRKKSPKNTCALLVIHGIPR